MTDTTSKKSSSNSNSSNGVESLVYPSQNIFEFNNYIFSSKFDNGNLLKVEKGPGAHEFYLWTAGDNYGTLNARTDGTNAWFHFCVSGMAKGITLKLQVMNATNHSSLYKQDMRPVFRNKASGSNWQRVRNTVRFTKGESERCAYLYFEHTVDADEDTIYFAFTYPYSYEMVQKDLEELESHVNDLKAPGTLFYQREILTTTPEDRNVDLLTITSTDGAGDKMEPAWSGLLPNYPIVCDKRPPLFPNKEVFFISARVHPGEVPAQHTFKGILDFLMDPDDVRAKALRKVFVFKLIPMLNPDGVYRGHFRMDQFGNNLNRYYTQPDPTQQPAIYAAKSLLDYYASQNRLSMYLDLHSHASKRGCFIYGNVMDTVEEQVQNQLYCNLIALNTPHFDYPSCLFSREHMTRIDPGDMKKGLTAEGSGRVATYLSHGIIHSYTLECNYNTSKTTNEVPSTVGQPGGQTQDYPLSAPASSSSEKYTPQIYHGVGRACVLAMLDIRGINPCSRVPNSKWQSLEKLRAAIMKEVGLRKEYRAFRAKQRAASVNNIGRRGGKRGSSEDTGVVFEGTGVNWKARTCAYEKERANSAPKPSDTIEPASLIPPAQQKNRLARSSVDHLLECTTVMNLGAGRDTSENRDSLHVHKSRTNPPNDKSNSSEKSSHSMHVVDADSMLLAIPPANAVTTKGSSTQNLPQAPIAIAEVDNNVHSDDYIKKHLVGDGEKSIPPKAFFRGSSASRHNHMDKHLNDLIHSTEAVGEVVTHPAPPSSDFAHTMKATMAGRHASSSSSSSHQPSLSPKLPPKIPLSSYRSQSHIDKKSEFSSSLSSSPSSGVQSGKKGLKYPFSHHSTLSQAGKRTFGKSGSPAEGGGSLSTNITVGMTEDLSRLTMTPSKKTDEPLQSHSLPLTPKNLAIVQRQQHRQ